MQNLTLPKLETLPENFSLEGIISITLIEGILKGGRNQLQDRLYKPHSS
ncbi:hypothetical protein PCC7805_03606 [Planktothrix agardhii]|jgi:hypothetical protein|nr:hypothetical protein PCC7805_03606 [Planktothrix agardhii]CAD5973193.1 hypothetical protein NO365_03953 [Planktothrix agardhii]